MQTLDTLMIRHLLLPAKRRGLLGLVVMIAAAIAACEVRTMGMGLQRSDGRNAGIADALIVQLAQVLLPVL
ncbi:hypothetical protein [Gymnodinialimonas hymeniacidonis]|uniref:hypothetical protein n=1 Tax=Gymnodinialimonas hymeniacidonis TaxID=3126508 RepID=UPI0034C668C4